MKVSFGSNWYRKEPAIIPGSTQNRHWRRRFHATEFLFFMVPIRTIQMSPVAPHRAVTHTGGSMIVSFSSSHFSAEPNRILAMHFRTQLELQFQEGTVGSVHFVRIKLIRFFNTDNLYFQMQRCYQTLHIQLVARKA